MSATCGSAAARGRRSPSLRRRQRGMVTVVAILFLIAVVVFALGQMLNVSGGNVIDGRRQGDSTAAFYLAESGIDKTRGAIASALIGTFTNSTCTGMAATVGSPYTLGRGSVAVSAVSTPAACDNTSAVLPQCNTCTVTSTGTVGNATRTVTQAVALASANGVYCNSATTDCTNNPTVTWQLNLRNTSGVGGVGMFALSYEQQGNTSASCAAASNCREQFEASSPSNGNNSVGLQGNAVVIPAGTTYPIYQVISKTGHSAVEVGAFFLGTGTVAPTGPTTSPGAASYWNSSTGATGTVGTTGTTGGTNDGTATSGGTCAAPSANNQTCTSWCYGGDTLVFSFSSNVTAVTDALTAVTFGTNASVGQNIALTNVAKYPTAAVTGAPTGIDAEIWYASNPNLTGTSPLATSASSWKGRGTGAVGAQWTSNNADTTSVTGAVLTVGSSFANWPIQVISQGDIVTYTAGGGSPACTAGASCGTVGTQVLPLLAGEQLGGRGRYNLTSPLAVAAANNRVWTIKSSVLRVSACTTCFFASGDASGTGMISGRTLGAQATLQTLGTLTEVAGGVGRYALSGGTPALPTYVAPASTLYVGSPNTTTIYLPSDQPQPSVTAPAMLLTVKSGTGVMAPGTTVRTVSAPGSPNAATSSFTVSTEPTTPLDGASICAGTCAFFVPGGTTSFSITRSTPTSNFNYWTAGFTCLNGVNITPQSVKSTSSNGGRWTEPVL